LAELVKPVKQKNIKQTLGEFEKPVKQQQKNPIKTHSTGIC